MTFALICFQIRFGDPQQRVRRAAVRHLQWFKNKRLRFRALAQQFPVMSARIAEIGYLQLVVTLQMQIVDKPAKSFISESQTRLNFGKLRF